ncbi:hypothetical protein [Dyella mobilis]|uniref:Uncharacterized protein n=1 Tax=Dyella mobilis TaxID=1849582 RepID=A0ABS2KER1_9GAMM|nr:hypothetical protein [Dyella mobilis]MBM7129403.1 hypothetical protein [Dyella mobilis]GLQ98332.1 hypothetical protein GCM10007863_27520 [Dyella mobilis]
MAEAIVGPYHVGSLGSCTDQNRGWKGEYVIRLGEELIHRETVQTYFTGLIEASHHALEIGKQHAQRLIDEAEAKA